VLGAPEVRLAELEDDLGWREPEARTRRRSGADEEGVRLRGGWEQSGYDDPGRNATELAATLDERPPIAHQGIVRFDFRPAVGIRKRRGVAQ
jgi:hypothetical protein